MDLPLCQSLRQAADLDIDDPLHVLAAEGMEEDNLVDPVQELRTEMLAERLHHLTPGP